MPKILQTKNEGFAKVLVLISILIVAAIFLYSRFPEKFQRTVAKDLVISVSSTVSGTKESRKFNSVLVELNNFSANSRDINIDTHDFSLIDKRGNTFSTLDFTGIAMPQLPESFVLKANSSISGYVTFVDVEDTAGEGFLVYRPKDSSRPIKIPVNFKLPVTY